MFNRMNPNEAYVKASETLVEFLTAYHFAILHRSGHAMIQQGGCTHQYWTIDVTNRSAVDAAPKKTIPEAINETQLKVIIENAAKYELSEGGCT